MAETNGDSRATILLIEEDDETRPLLARDLRDYGYRVVVAIDEGDAPERVGAGGVPAGLVLANLVGKSEAQALEVGRRVRERARYGGHTPLVVMPERYGKDVEGTGVKVGGSD